MITDLTDDPLVLGGLQHVVIHDVAGGWTRIAVATIGEFLVAVLEEVELQLRPGLHRESHVVGLRELVLQDLSRRDRHRRPVLLVGDVADHHHRLFEPRAHPQRGHVGDHPEVAVAGLPARVVVAGQRLHLHVDRQQVQAGVQSLVPEDLLQEEVGQHALAHEPTLEIGKHA